MTVEQDYLRNQKLVQYNDMANQCHEATVFFASAELRD